MYARVVLGASKSVPFRAVSSIQGCPYRGVPLYVSITHTAYILLCCVDTHVVCLNTCSRVCTVILCRYLLCVGRARQEEPTFLPCQMKQSS